ncbi:MAG: hypothetical protein F6J93_38340 [Oscillatoria sp. SIO1A7]|nr:hypothetical protein [Oscillatoria sp. SIO1A7]
MLLFLAAIAVDNGDFLHKFYIPELISISLFQHFSQKSNQPKHPTGFYGKSQSAL